MIKGYDAAGKSVELGDTDSMGLRVGYIDDNGLAWQSRLERDMAIGADAIKASTLLERMDAIDILDKHDIMPKHREAALATYIEHEAVREITENKLAEKRKQDIDDYFTYKKRAE